MYDWREILVKPDAKIIDVLAIIDKGSLRSALIVDDTNHLLGIVTDGDVRRGLLRGVSMDAPVKDIMNPKPVTAPKTASQKKVFSIMGQYEVNHVPLLDDAGCVCGLEVLDEVYRVPKKENWVVLMAGGLGARLRPMTENCPKPLLKVGSKPILEIILENFKEAGFEKFYVSVNYKSHMIQDYFGDGSKWGVRIEYLEEKDKLGTGGSLNLLPEKPEHPLIVMNGDIMTKVNFGDLLNFHTEHSSQATMCVREYSYTVPYGVIDIDEHNIQSIREKPNHSMFVNAGIYVLNPEVLSFVPENRFFNMTDLFHLLKEEGRATAAFPLREYWLDIGRFEDFEKAHRDYQEHFDDSE